MPVRRLSGAVASRGAVMNLDSGLRTGRFRPIVVKPPPDHSLSVRQDFAPVYRNTWWLRSPAIAARYRRQFCDLHQARPATRNLHPTALQESGWRYHPIQLRHLPDGNRPEIPQRVATGFPPCAHDGLSAGDQFRIEQRDAEAEDADARMPIQSLRCGLSETPAGASAAKAHRKSHQSTWSAAPGRGLRIYRSEPCNC